MKNPKFLNTNMGNTKISGTQLRSFWKSWDQKWEKPKFNWEPNGNISLWTKMVNFGKASIICAPEESVGSKFDGRSTLFVWMLAMLTSFCVDPSQDQL